MKRVTIFVGIISLFSFGLIAQSDTAQDTTYWQQEGFGQLTFNQASFKNWAAGGQNSIAFTFTGNYLAKYLKGKHSWESNVDMAYGLLKYKREPFRKNDDQLYIQSKYGLDINNGKIFWTSAVGFRTQFSDGFNYPNDSTVISTFMSPGYLGITTGFDYKPCDYFSLYVSPIAFKFTFVTDQILANEGAFGVTEAVYDENGDIIEEGKNVRSELGANLNLAFKRDIVKNVNLDTKANFFINYSEKEKELRGNVDINWVTTISMKINDYLTTSLILHLIYDQDVAINLFDDDGNPIYSQRPDGSFYEDENGNKIQKTGPRTQFKQVFGLGLSYKFAKPKKGK